MRIAPHEDEILDGIRDVNPFLLGQISDESCPFPLAHAFRGSAQPEDFPLPIAINEGQAPQEGRFARSIWSDNGNKLTPIKFEGDIFKDCLSRNREGKPADCQNCHAQTQGNDASKNSLEFQRLKHRPMIRWPLVEVMASATPQLREVVTFRL